MSENNEMSMDAVPPISDRKCIPANSVFEYLGNISFHAANMCNKLDVVAACYSYYKVIQLKKVLGRG